MRNVLFIRRLLNKIGFHSIEGHELFMTCPKGTANNFRSKGYENDVIRESFRR